MDLVTLSMVKGNSGESSGSGGGIIVIQLAGTIISNQTAQPGMSVNIDDWDELWNNIQSGQPVFAFYKNNSGQVMYYLLKSADIYQGRKRLYLQEISGRSWHQFMIQGPQYPGGPTNISKYEGTYAAQS